MSEQAVKATRRQIVKAFGPAAVETLDRHAAAIDGMKQRLESGLSEQSDTVREAIAHIRKEQADREAALQTLLATVVVDEQKRQAWQADIDRRMAALEARGVVRKLAQVLGR